MCLGIPGLVVELPPVADDMAQGLVEFSGLRRRVCLACVPEARLGDYVLVHAGIAISRIDPDEAQRVFGYLAEMGAADEWTAEGGAP
jgi:hydrogenase expression/formation protein HypC